MDELWDGLLRATVRSGPLVLDQPPAVQEWIRAAFDRLAQAYETADAPGIPVSVKLASGREPVA